MADYKVWEVREPWLDIHCALGEGPYFEAATNTLRFVDIKKKKLHTVGLAEGPRSLKTLDLSMPVGVTADIEGVDSSKKILVGGKNGVYLLHRETGKLELLNRFYDSYANDEKMRSNDGAVDPQGRFWIATMNDFWVGPPQAEGTLFRFNNDLTRDVIQEYLTIPNSVGWSRDQKTLYFTHSTERCIYAWDYHAASGSLSNKRKFWKHDGPGEPDGFKVDTEGHIWQAIYGESKVLRISPEGKVVGEIRYPTRAITCPVFVGTEIWVTSASEEDEKEVESAKYGGGVFKVDVGIGGLKDFKFRLDKSVQEL